ncbi:VRR-NUC domain-containing protein [Neoaquamicrobium sediminum]|uniref:VRR-NUC domain-containing protein n=1 Tax=Neoaquamicrobium sediminum TaxID=1849104 RepID=UPI0015646358|nr:VRR-NUC domain-containing protein [Mesorhizobium sediminum]NRC54200.1 VRR-NUC domain-containing protein [Mesorhizobium sediminum]
MLESYIERKVCEYAKKLGWLVRKLQWVGRHGAPDRLFIRAGRVVFIEFKAPGKKPTEHQRLELERLREQGMEAYVVDDIDEGKFILSSGRNHEALI